MNLLCFVLGFCLVLVFFFLPGCFWIEMFGFSWCPAASWGFLFVCFNAMKSNRVNVYLGCWYTWIWIIVHWRFKLRWIFKAECYLLYSFGVFFPEGFGEDVLICGATYRTAHGKINPPGATLEQSFECQTGTFVIFPELLCFFLFFRNATEFWVIGVGRLQSYF